MTLLQIIGGIVALIVLFPVLWGLVWGIVDPDDGRWPDWKERK